MSEMAKAARAAMKKKAQGLTKADPHQKVDSSDWTPPEMLNADVKTGMRPVSRRAFKKGGKVMGEKAAVRADRKPRASGGKSFADAMVNRNAKAANEEREGKKHIGGLKKGGRVGKYVGGARNEQEHARQMEVAEKEYGERQKMTDEDKANLPRKAGGRAHKLLGGYASTEGKPVGGPAAIIAGKRKAGGRTGKFLGGPMMQPGGMMGATPAMNAMGNAAASPTGLPLTDPREELVAKGRFNFGAGASGHPYKKGGAVKQSESRKKKAIGGAFGEYLSPALMAVNALRGEDDEEKGDKKANGGKVSHAAWEHSKKDLREDRKLAKKHGMSLDKWEKSKLDEKHDRQQSMKGLKSGGKIEKVMHEFKEGELHSGSKKGPEVKSRKQAIAIALSEAGKSRKAKQGGGALASPELQAGMAAIAARRAMGRKEGGSTFSGKGYPEKVPGVTGGRIAKASGGKAKGKTNVNIIIAAGGRPQQDGQPMAPTMPPRPPGAQPVAVPPPSAAAPAAAPVALPVAMPMAGAGAGAPAPMGRKHGGRTFKSYKDMKAGAGSGEGRLEKTEIAEHKRMMRKDGGHVYPKMKYGAGSGEGRLEKIDEYGLKGPGKNR